MIPTILDVCVRYEYTALERLMLSTVTDPNRVTCYKNLLQTGSGELGVIARHAVETRDVCLAAAICMWLKAFQHLYVKIPFTCEELVEAMDSVGAIPVYP